MSWIPKKQTLFLWFSILMGFSLVYSRFMISFCMFAWMIMAFFSWSYSLNRPVLSREVKSLGKRMFHSSNRGYLLLTGFFVIPLILGLHSGDQSEFIERLRIKLPYLGLPIAFLMLPPLREKAWRFLLVSINLALISSACYVLFQYAMHFELINEQLGQGIPMPTPVNHTRYSLMISLIILFDSASLYKYKTELSPLLYRAGTISVLFLIIFLHILSVRSGLAVFYIGYLWLVISYAWNKSSVLPSVIMLTGIILLPLLAYHLSPPLKKRVDYMRYDIEQFIKGEGQRYSDSERIYSLQAGWTVFRDNPWVGVGTGDVRHAMQSAYRDMGMEDNKLPHNQFITVLAANGLIGLLLFLYCLCMPFVDQRRYQSIYYSSFFLVVLLSFMVENTVENSVGVAFHLVFMLFLLHRERSRSDDAFAD